MARVTLRPQAEADLFALYRYIAEEAGRAVAGGYIDRIEEACFALEAFPLHGRSREDIRPGLRALAFERGAVVVYRVGDADVAIVRIFYGRQDYERILRDERSDE